MKKKMISMTILSLVVLAAAGAAYLWTKNGVFFSVAITFGTIFYHFAMRLAVGGLIDARYHDQMDYTRKWFREKAFERSLYQVLKVKTWKKRMPTYNPQSFDLKVHSAEEILQASCQAEVVHEVIMPLSFVPILFSTWFGALGVFVLTSCAAFVFDSIFVIMQRYNRPRLMRLLKRAAR